MPLGAELHPLTVLPFIAILLAIAILPLVAGHWWERNSNKAIVAAALSIPLAIYLVARHGGDGGEKLLHSGGHYLSFIVLLGSLFIITGGIHVAGSLSGTPLVNTGILAFGAVIASFVGTTGASMLLIRPLLRANASRQQTAHIVVFFIFIVSNCGGLLTPLGDPPLFLGFLAGVPFEWTLQLWREWAVVNVILLVVFHVWDLRVLDIEEKRRPGSQLEEVMKHEPLRVRGLWNLFPLAGIVATIYAAGSGWGNDGKPWPFGLQELGMAAIVLTAYVFTPPAVRRDNRFTFGPIIEVAVIFAGIFVTMVPALELLNHHGPSLGLKQPWQYFWATGLLSSFLDNAPTYLAFAATEAGLYSIPATGRYLAELLTQGPTAENSLAAISCGSVFMGANTYIGNGPNFMVKAIADESGVRTPSFFGYMLYSVGILIPIFVVVTLVFFR